MLAGLLRQIECPVHGVRIVRLPGHRFRGELSEEVKPVRDVAGQIGIQGTMQAVTSVIEGWIREYPDHWLWLPRRLRWTNRSAQSAPHGRLPRIPGSRRRPA